VLGYPIRTSSDQRSVDNSPRHIAASHVLHRPLMPRHPPCALTHLHTKNTQQKAQQQFARCSQPLSNTQTPHPTTKDGATTTHPTTGRGPVVSGPNSVSDDFLTGKNPGRHACCCTRHRPTTDRHPSRLTIPGWDRVFVVLLRKEVIQPHLPVRLPCYDFVPIADPTFDSSPPHGLGHWLRVLPTFMT
jgi:hypothetical protein